MFQFVGINLGDTPKCKVAGFSHVFRLPDKAMIMIERVEGKIKLEQGTNCLMVKQQLLLEPPKMLHKFNESMFITFQST